MAFYGGYDAMPFNFGAGAHAGPTSAYSFVGAGAANVPYSSHKLTRATPRREMEARKRVGTGHQTTRREVSIIGRRTGVVIPDTIRRDARGFEDPTHFFDEVREEEELRHASPNVYRQPNARQSLGGAASRPPAPRVSSPPRRTSMVPAKAIRAISPIPSRASPAVRAKKKYVESPPSYADEPLDDPSPVPRRGRQHGRHQDSSTDVSRGRSPPARKSHKDKYADRRSSKTSYKSRRHQEYSEDTSRDPTPARKRKVTPPRKPSMKTSTAMQTIPTPKGMATQTSRNASTVNVSGRRSTPSASPAPRKRPSPAPAVVASKRRAPTPPADVDLNESGFGNDYEYDHHATPSPPKKRTPVKKDAAPKPRGRPVGGGVSKVKTTAAQPMPQKKGKTGKAQKPRQPREKAVYVAPRSGLAEAVLNESTTGVRRSSRRMFRPLQYWRNERVVYEREKGGGKLLPEVVDVLIRSPDAGIAPRSRK